MRGGHDRTSGSLVAASGSTASAVEGDPLSDVLRSLRLTGALFFVVEATSPWTSRVPAATEITPVVLPGAQHLVSYHVVTRGRCWASVTDAGTWLEAGDVIVVPHGDPYVMSTSLAHAGGPAEGALSFFKEMAARRLPSTLPEGGGGPDGVHLICGFLACDVLPFNPILSTLPPLVHVRRPEAPEGNRLNHLIEFALDESRVPRAGSDCVLLRISELLFVEVVRRHLAALRPEETGWLAGLRDASLGRALALLHREPSRPWTLETLARESGLSRSVLSERFHHFLGQPPMQYLTRWRMQLAATRLTDGAAKVGAVALEVGYESEAAFSRAFKKAVGVPPATWRDRKGT